MAPYACVGAGEAQHTATLKAPPHLAPRVFGVVLAGGEGTRLRPITLSRPKPLVPVAGQACIDYVIRSLVQAGIRDVIVTTGYLSEQLIRSVGAGSRLGAAILYSFEEEPVGTAGAVKKVAGFLDGTFVVASGDVLADVDVAQLLAVHKSRGAAATMALTRVDRPSEFGIVGLDDGHRVVRFAEKPAPKDVFSNLVNAGIYVLEPDVLDLVPAGTKFDFSKQVFPAMLERGLGLYGHQLTGLWMDIGRPSDLLAANLRALERAQAGADPHSLIRSPTDGVEMEGPCFVGAGVIMAHCQLRSSLVYERATIGHGAVITGSLVLAGARIGAGARVERSVLGEDCTVRDGAQVIDSVIGDGQEIEGTVASKRIPATD